MGEATDERHEPPKPDYANLRRRATRDGPHSHTDWILLDRAEWLEAEVVRLRAEKELTNGLLVRSAQWLDHLKPSNEDAAEVEIVILAIQRATIATAEEPCPRR